MAYLLNYINLQRIAQARWIRACQRFAILAARCHGGRNNCGPPLEERHLLRGHAVHFRCRREDVAGLRIDLMSSLRGVAGFEELWARRTTIEVAGEPIDLLALEDLVRAKKTQRDKDWPMIRRLVEQSYFAHSRSATPENVSITSH